ALRLNFSLNAPNATAGLTRLRLHLAGPRSNAAHRLYALLFYTEAVVLEAGSQRLRLPPSALEPSGFSPDDGLFPYPPTAWEGYRLLQEYFVFPEKFFFIDVMLPETGFASGNASSLTCTFQLETRLPDNFPTFSVEDFALFATPAVNLFPFETVPVKADHKRESYPVRANAPEEEGYVPYQIESVNAVSSSGEETPYLPVLSIPHDPAAPAYTVHCPKNTKGRREMSLSLIYPPNGQVPETVILSLDALYSNGELPGRLNIGDVKMPLSTSPALAEFTNLTPPTRPVEPIADGNTLWSLLAHLHLNYLPLSNAQTLKALLLTYLPPKADALYANANKRRIESILSLNAQTSDFLWKGRPVSGIDLTLTLDGDGFSNPGDMSLFGMVAAKFLHEYSPINSFMRVTVTDPLNQRSFQWLKHQQSPSRL
ncbi:MAG: type VI secretion system baseplate subunit TssF, partial [Desulfovibrionaceae bacterium]|nr:type VI secretion system baseplate subunit TssF [Desulfovibrionaceae bacterium]